MLVLVLVYWLNTGYEGNNRQVFRWIISQTLVDYASDSYLRYPKWGEREREREPLPEPLLKSFIQLT